MPFSSQPVPAVYSNTGTATPLPIPFLFYDDAEIIALRVESDGETLTTLVDGTDYTLSGAGNEAGGTLTPTGNGVVPAGTKTIIWLDVPFTQPDRAQPGESFNPKRFNRILDKQVQRMAQLDEAVQRTFKLSIANTGTEPSFPPLVPNSFLATNASSILIWSAGVAGAPVSAAMEPVVSAATLADARTAMGVHSGGIDNALLRADGVGGAIQGSTAVLGDDGSLTLKSTGVAASLGLERTDTHGDDANVAGIKFTGRNSAGDPLTYAQIFATADLDDAGAEDAFIKFLTTINGVSANRFFIGDGLWAAGNADPGAGAIDADGYKLNGSDLPFTKEFVSADQTITAAGALTLAHGLGVAPKLVSLELVCVTAEHGYSIGDILENAAQLGQVSTSDNRGASVVPDATNLNIRFGSGAASFGVINKSTGVAASITNANWRARFKAWA